MPNKSKDATLRIADVLLEETMRLLAQHKYSSLLTMLQTIKQTINEIESDVRKEFKISTPKAGDEYGEN
jgi:hypothetical protein